MTEDQRQHLEELRQIYEKRCRVLERQAATQGLGASAQLIMELDDVHSNLEHINAQLRDSLKSATRSKQQVEDLFVEATRKKLIGDIGYALQLFRQVQSTDPSYPRIEATIAALEHESKALYVDIDGKVNQNIIVHRARIRLSPKEQV